MQFQPAPATQHHLPHPITVVSGRRKPQNLDLAKAQQSYKQYSLYNYPSPPMSSPPSPPRTYVATSGAPDTRTPSTFDPYNPPAPAPAPPAPAPSYRRGDVAPHVAREQLPPTSLPFPSPGVFPPAAYAASPHLQSSRPPPIAERNYFPQRAAIPLSGQSPGVQISEIGRVSTTLKAGRSSRRGKTHVQKACVNCKKAHLSCDAQRPCARCVTSGKQETCHDVEHKKRGRPRLRDDRDTRVGREIAPTEQQPVAAPPFPPTTAYRPQEPSAHRRTQSGRVLRSSRPSVGQQSQPTALQRHTIGANPGASPLGRTQAARVFANLSFRILRANKAFQEQFAQGADVRGRDFSAFVEPRHDQDLQRLGTDLRNEREQRDPMALPTIFSDQEQEAINTIDEANVDQYVRGSRERRDDWWFNGVQRPIFVQLGQVGSFPFVLFTMPYTTNMSMTLPPPMPGYGGTAYAPGPPAYWESGFQPSPGGYPQPGSGPTTPSLSLQSLAATLPPTSVSVGVPSYGMSPRYPSGSSEYFPTQSISQRTSLHSPSTQYSQAPYHSTSGTATRPQSTASEPPGVAVGSSSSRRPATYHGQARTFGAMQEEPPPVPSLPGALAAVAAAQQEAEGEEEGRKRRRLNIKELTD